MKDAYLRSTLTAAALVLTSLCFPPRADAKSPELRLYVLDCGHATFTDVGGFSEHDPKYFQALPKPPAYLD